MIGTLVQPEISAAGTQFKPQIYQGRGRGQYRR